MFAPVKKRISQFFGSRMPVADLIELNQRSTYIIPTKAGFLLAGVIIIMMIGATNYQNNLAFLLTFLIVSIGMVSMVSTFKNLQSIRIKLGRVESVFASEMLNVSLRLSSQSAGSHHAIAWGFEGYPLQYTNAYAEKEQNVVIAIQAPERGWFALPRIKATSRFPFGLFVVWAWFRFASPILIYPKLLEPPTSSGLGESETDDSGKTIKGSDELYGLKSYQSGDPISRIDWKALAREKGVFTKEFVAYQSQDLVFDWDAFHGVETETRLSYLCYLVVDASKNNYEFALRLPNEFVGPSSGDTHLKRCLESLATYQKEKPIEPAKTANQGS